MAPSANSRPQELLNRRDPLARPLLEMPGAACRFEFLFVASWFFPIEVSASALSRAYTLQLHNQWAVPIAPGGE